MVRQIFEVQAKCVDPSGGWVSSLPNYPKSFDSKKYNNDIDLTFKRAQGEFASVWSSMCQIDNRQMQCVMLLTADGIILDKKVLGAIPELPDPEPED